MPFFVCLFFPQVSIECNIDASVKKSSQLLMLRLPNVNTVVPLWRQPIRFVAAGACTSWVIATVVSCYRIVSIFDWLVFDIVCDPGAWIYVERQLRSIERNVTSVTNCGNEFFQVTLNVFSGYQHAISLCIVSAFSKYCNHWITASSCNSASKCNKIARWYRIIGD